MNKRDTHCSSIPVFASHLINTYITDWQTMPAVWIQPVACFCKEFHWNTVTPVHIFYSCFHAYNKSSVVETETVWLAKTKIFTPWPFKKKSLPTPNLHIYWYKYLSIIRKHPMLLKKINCCYQWNKYSM